MSFNCYLLLKIWISQLFYLSLYPVDNASSRIISPMRLEVLVGQKLGINYK